MNILLKLKPHFKINNKTEIGIDLSEKEKYLKYLPLIFRYEKNKSKIIESLTLDGKEIKECKYDQNKLTIEFEKTKDKTDVELKVKKEIDFFPFLWDAKAIFKGIKNSIDGKKTNYFII